MNWDDFTCQDAIGRTVYMTLRSRTNDNHLIEDISQSVLIVCWKYERDNGFPPSQSFIITVARHMHCSWVRRQNRRRKMLLLPSGYEKGSSKEDPALTTEKKENSVVFLSMLNDLPALYRDITIRHVVDGWTHKRIASDKGVPVNIIKTQFRRAKALLEEAVKRYFMN